jgi:hypothetical protein
MLRFCAVRVKDFAFQVESFTVRVASFALRVEDFTVRVTSFGLWVEDFTFRVASFALSAPGFSDRVQDFIVWVESLVFRVEALRLCLEAKFAEKTNSIRGEPICRTATVDRCERLAHAWASETGQSVQITSTPAPSTASAAT